MQKEQGNIINSSYFFSAKHYINFISLISIIIVSLSGYKNIFNDLGFEMTLLSVVFFIFLASLYFYADKFISAKFIDLSSKIIIISAFFVSIFIVLFNKLSDSTFFSIAGIIIVFSEIIFFSKTIYEKTIRTLILISFSIFTVAVLKLPDLFILGGVFTFLVYLLEKYSGERKLSAVAFLGIIGFSLIFVLNFWAIFPIIIFSAYNFRDNFKRIAGNLFGIIFLSAALSFIFNFGLKNLPPITIIILNVLLSLIIGYSVSRRQEVLMASGLLLLLDYLIFIPNLQIMIFLLPALLFSVEEYKIDFSAGRII